MRADGLRLLLVIAVQAAILAAIPSRQVKARAAARASRSRPRRSTRSIRSPAIT